MKRKDSFDVLLAKMRKDQKKKAEKHRRIMNILEKKCAESWKRIKRGLQRMEKSEALWERGNGISQGAAR